MSGYTEIALLQYELEKLRAKHQYELEKLRAELAKKDAKIERLKIRMAFNAQLQDENNELQQQLEAKDAELSNYKRATDLAYNGSELETRQQLASAQADNDQLRAELAALKAFNKAAKVSCEGDFAALKAFNKAAKVSCEENSTSGSRTLRAQGGERNSMGAGPPPSPRTGMPAAGYKRQRYRQQVVGLWHGSAG